MAVEVDERDLTKLERRLLTDAEWLADFSEGAQKVADVAAVASQANIGGSTSALALARSFDRGDLVVPAILVGSLGNAIGTYLGFWIAAWLR